MQDWPLKAQHVFTIIQIAPTITLFTLALDAMLFQSVISK
jgi:hypothetical protein